MLNSHPKSRPGGTNPTWKNPQESCCGDTGKLHGIPGNSAHLECRLAVIIPDFLAGASEEENPGTAFLGKKKKNTGKTGIRSGLGATDPENSLGRGRVSIP